VVQKVVTTQGPVRTKAGRRKSLDLGAYMAQCDANYHRLLQLVPTLKEVDEHAFALTIGDATTKVSLSVEERTPFTTLVRLSQSGGGMFSDAEPRLLVRLYHDAENAEVVEYQNERRFQPIETFPNAKMRGCHEKVKLAQFLAEYLSHCLAHGQVLDQVDFPTQS